MVRATTSHDEALACFVAAKEFFEAITLNVYQLRPNGLNDRFQAGEEKTIQRLGCQPLPLARCELVPVDQMQIGCCGLDALG
jgi:hypothetical protein